MATIDSSWYSRPPGLPHDTSAGGIVVRVAKGRIYIALVREDELVDYILPKGRIERDEDPVTAARREIREEAGLDSLELLADLGARDRLNYRKTRWLTTHYFLFRASKKKGKPTDTSHSYHLAWFPLDELPSMFWPDQRELVESCRLLIQQRLAGIDI